MKNFFTLLRRSSLFCFAIVCCLITGGQLQGQTLAFPGAEGFGRYAEGARGAATPEVYIVTNLNDSGTGSFRDAVSQPGRFVVFATGGIIRLESPIAIPANTTIAGQTAPGDGVVLVGKRVTFSGSNNTIARYLRIRLGAAGNGKNEDASGISNGANMIFDHMSFTWGLDEVFSINWDGKGTSIDNITIQNSIIGQGLHRHNHSAGGLIQAPDEGKVSLLKNLYISNKTRNPKVKGINEFVNNVVYNYGNYGNTYGHSLGGAGYIMGGESEGISEANIINNYFVGGPQTSPGQSSPFSRGNGNFRLYGSGNYWDNNKDGVLNGNLVPYENSSSGYPGITDFRTEPFDYPAKNPDMTAEEAYQYIIDNAGPVYPRRDQLDQLLINEVASRGTEGLYVYRETDIPLANGGVGELFQAPVPPDSDADGMPDAWEDAHGLNKDDASDATAYSTEENGYLNIEVYINSIMETPAPDFLRPPTGVVATATSTTEIELSWEDNTDSEDNYIIERSADGETFTALDELAANTTSFTDTGLDTKTEYHYRVKAVNATEESAYSTPVSVKTMGVPDTPSNPLPADESVYSQSANLNLQWEGSANTDTYKVYFGTDAGSLSHQGDAATPAFQVTGLAENTTYYWRVDAVNEIGTSEGPVWSFETLRLASAELVAHYSFDAASGTAAEDETVFGNDGTITGFTPQWVSGKAGNALDMSDAAGTATARIEVPSNNQNYFDDHSFTISMWVKINKPYSYAAGEDAYLIHKGTFEAGTGKWYGIQLKDENLTFAIDDGDTKSSVSEAVGASSPHNLFNDEWKHIVAIRDKDNSRIKLYINGQLAKQGTSSTGTIGKSDALTIGNSAEMRPFRDIIDEVKLFNYALPESEITALYNADEPESPAATNPTPAHEANNIDAEEVEISWTSPATSFNVYLGTSAEDLALEIEDTDGTADAFTELENGTTYYWRVDALTEEGTTTGDVWSFTTSVPVQTGDLVGHWKLDGTSGTLAQDSGPYENHGRLTNIPDPQWVEGKEGNALDFSNWEENSHIQIPDQPHLNFDESSFSIAFWMKAPPELGAGSFYIFHKGTFNTQNGGTGHWHGLEVKEGLIRYAVDDDITKTDVTIDDNSPFFTDEWVHVVTIRDTENDKLKIYLNGELMAEKQDGTNAPIGNSFPLLVGNNYDLNSPYKGTLDDFRIYDYSLSSQDIAALYSGERPDFIVTEPSPFNEATEMEPSEVELSWTGTAQSYNLYLGTDENTLSLESEGITGSSYTLTELAHATTYYWRIDPVVGDENGTGEVWSFTTREAVLTPSNPTPAPNQSGVEPVGLPLSWSGNAQSYKIYMGTSEDVMNLIAENLNLTTYTVENLDFSKTYYWKVEAITGPETASSGTWSFSTRESISLASAPQPAHETDGMETEEVVLNWAGDAESYNIYVGTDPDDPELRKTGSKETSYTIFWPLDQGTQYFWRVDAVKGEEVKTGEIWTFTTLSATGTANLAEKNVFRGYPSPFTDKLTVEFTLEKPETAELLLYNNQGRLIHSFIKTSLTEGRHILNFSTKNSSLRDLNEGLYYLVLQTSEGKSVQKVVHFK